MSKYYLLEKKVKTCSPKLRDKYVAEGFEVIATCKGYNSSISLV